MKLKEQKRQWEHDAKRAEKANTAAHHAARIIAQLVDVMDYEEMTRTKIHYQSAWDAAKDKAKRYLAVCAEDEIE